MKLSITHKRFWTDSALALTLSMGTSIASAQITAFTPGYANQPALATINALGAYNLNLSGNGVTIGIVDTGINPNHVAFNNNAIVAGMGWSRSSSDLLTNNWVSQSSTTNVSFLNDLNADQTNAGHGTFVSSIAAGRPNTLNGNIMGVAYNSKLVIGSIVFNQYVKDTETLLALGLSDSQVAKSIDFVSSQPNVKVINNSWGVPADSNIPLATAMANYSNAEPQTVAALKRAQDLGKVIVFAAGNDSVTYPGAPATLPSIDSTVLNKGGWIVVAATSVRGVANGVIEMAQQSALGYTPGWYTDYCGQTKNYCISAPGGFEANLNPPVSGLDIRAINGANSTSNTAYKTDNGTSFAAPLVTGAVAVLAEQFPWMTSKNLGVTILTTGTTAADPSETWGRGLLDVGKAVKGPGLFEEDFSANVPSSASSTFSNDIGYRTGYDGGIIKSGDGTLALTGNNLYTGNTYLNGGTLVASTQSSLGNTAADLQFNGGALKLGTNFDLTRNLNIGSAGGTLDINGYTKLQTFSMYGAGQFGVTGGGQLTLNQVNPQQGGLAVSGGSTVVAAYDSYIGQSGSKVSLDKGTLNISGFDSSVSAFNRPLAIGSNGGVINTGSNTLAFTGGLIDAFGSSKGQLNFTGGNPLKITQNFTLNALWGADYTIPSGIKQTGNGGPGADPVSNKPYVMTVDGKVSPGNLPGTSEITGSITVAPDGEIDIDVDGTGTANGAGNYDRFVFTNALGKFTTGGILWVNLRGISGNANNNYSPPVGQGFKIVSAPGGVYGSFIGIVQPVGGLLPGTRFDAVYGSTTLSLYATPTSYANIAAAGVASNSNRNQTGVILEQIRPNAGVLSSNVTTKFLFDSLAPQTSNSLPVALDQLAGVSYAQSIGMNYENTKFLIDENTLAVTSQRRGEGGHLINTATSSEEKLGENKEEVWGKVMGRQTTWRGDGTGSTLNDTLGGLIGGIQKHLDPQSLAGLSIAYASGNSSISNSLGSGLQQNIQLMGYGSLTADNGFFVQGSAGGGSGQINANRNVSMMATNYNALIYTANLAANALVGWGNHAKDAIGYEAGLGVNYMGMHNFGFNDKGGLPAYQLSANATDNYSFTTSIGGSASIPFEAQGIDWRAIAGVSLAHEFGDTVAYLNTTLLGNSMQLQSGSIGRDRLNVGLGLTGMLTKQTKVGLNIVNQSAQNWNATAITASARLEF